MRGEEVSDRSGLRATGRDDPAIGQDLAVVLEEDHAVAQQTPALLRMAVHNVSGIAACTVSWGTAWLMGAHRVTHSSFFAPAGADGEAACTV